MRITQRLRSHPVLAIGAVKVASQHSEAVRQCARVGMEERFLLNRIALNSSDVTPRHVQFSALIKANFAHAGLPFENRTAMPAGETANAIAINRLVKFAFADVMIQDFAKSGHQAGTPYIYCKSEGKIRTPALS